MALFSLTPEHSFVDLSVTLMGMLFFQGLLAAILFTLVGVAYYRRRSRPYLLVWVATATLVVETLFGILGLVVAVSPWTHILVDYGLDVVLVISILAAIHYARQLEASEQNTHDRA